MCVCVYVFVCVCVCVKEIVVKVVAFISLLLFLGTCMRLVGREAEIRLLSVKSCKTFLLSLLFVVVFGVFVSFCFVF